LWKFPVVVTVEGINLSLSKNLQLPLMLALLCLAAPIGLLPVSAAIQNFSAEDTTIVAAAPVILFWEVDAGDTELVITPTVGDIIDQSADGLGSFRLDPGPTSTTTYTLSSDGPMGRDNATITVTVGAPPTIENFSVGIDLEQPDLRRNLTWDVDGASAARISPGIGGVPASGFGYYQIVPAGALWDYLDDGSDQGAAWTTLEFDDGVWKSGLAELGYGEGDEATRVGYGPSGSAKFMTTYFRHAFTRTAVDAIEQLRLGIRYDDGAIVYLNGVEIGRFHLPDGEVLYTTPAVGDVPGDADDYTFANVPPELLREGNNVLAVEIHQSRPGSSDLSFDMMLEGLMDGSLAVAPTTNTSYTLSASNEFGTTSDVAEAVVSYTPFAAYRFDLATANDLTGETTAIAAGAGPPVLVPGKVGAGAFGFGGEGELRISGAFSTLGIGSSSAGMSIGFWLKAEASTNADIVLLDAGIELSKEDTAGGSALVIELPDREILVPDVFDGSWHHVLLAAVGGTVKVYRDGEPTVTTSFADGGFEFPSEWILGGATGGSNRFVGAVDEFVVFDRALGDADAVSLFTDGVTEFFLPRILQFEADDVTVAPGVAVEFKWFVVDADSVEVDHGVGEVDPSGERRIAFDTTTEVVLSASNSHGTRTREITVTTGALPEILKFRASPDTLPAGGGIADLEWHVLGSTSVSIDRGIGAVSPSGVIEISPSSFSSYIVTASNDFGFTTARTSVALVDEPGGAPWTMVVIPDTQHYSDSVANAPIFTEITRWIAEHREEHNIRFVLQLGDIVEHNNTIEWDRARSSMEELDGEVPYALTTGNHDLGPGGNASDRSGEFNLASRFGAGSPYASQPTMGGFFPEIGNPDYRESSYHTFHANGHDYLVLALEWTARDSVVEWANQVVSEHQNHRAILLTHIYLAAGSSLWGGGVGMGENNGQDLWEKLVSRHENFFLTANGHALSLGYLQSFGSMGNAVHQMLFNAQSEANGGDGWIRLLEFDGAGETVSVKTFSPHLEALGQSAWRSDLANQFTIGLSPFPAVDSDGDLIPDGWELAHGLDPDDAGDASRDPDRDGLNNLMEYALARRPFSPSGDRSEPPLSVEVLVDGGRLITFRRRIPSASQLVYTVEKSSDLQTWRSDPGDGSVFQEVSATGNGDASETVIVKDVEAGESNRTELYRLRVSL
jgi:hypothetical protein